MAPTPKTYLNGFVAGDSFQITRTITSLPAGRTIVKAWFTVKSVATEADPGLIQKVITTTPQAGIGQVTDDGTGDQIGAVLFIVTAADSALLGAVQAYVYDIQLKYDDGSIATVEIGSFTLAQGVTAATS